AHWQCPWRWRPAEARRTFVSTWVLLIQKGNGDPRKSGGRHGCRSLYRWYSAFVLPLLAAVLDGGGWRHEITPPLGEFDGVGSGHGPGAPDRPAAHQSAPGSLVVQSRVRTTAVIPEHQHVGLPAMALLVLMDQSPPVTEVKQTLALLL